MIIDPLNDERSTVTLVDRMGNDLSVVNAARVSFSTVSTELTDRDKGLIGFLARGCPKDEIGALVFTLATSVNREYIRDRLMEFRRMAVHWTPFAQVQLKFRIKAPFFVARQWFKHQIGVTRNEISRRYVSTPPEFHIPQEWRLQAPSIKQGSSDEPHALSTSISRTVGDIYDHIAELYNHLIFNENICPEQAREILPMATYTEWVETGSLAAYARVFNQRSDSHAQYEINQYAAALGQLVPEEMAISWRALTDG